MGISKVWEAAAQRPALVESANLMLDDVHQSEAAETWRYDSRHLTAPDRWGDRLLQSGCIDLCAKHKWTVSMITRLSA